MKKTGITAALLAALLLLAACASVPASVTDLTETETEEETTATVTAEETAEELTEETTEEQTEEPQATHLNYTNMKALWISQFDMSGIYTNSGKQRGKEEFTKLLCRVLDNTVKNHYNTVIFQVRPYADSMYPSDICPPCYIASGSYAKELEYDPFEILIEEAHKRDLSVQAWINPMRAMLEKEIKLVSDEYTIKQWYNDKDVRRKYLPVVSERVYLNVGEKEVRDLIVSGAVELLARYDVDGLHMDDYFYPTTDTSFDQKTYSEYKSNGGKKNLAAFRKECLSELVKALYDATKDSGADRIFGISPAGNMQTVLNSHFADVKTWCGEPGYIDYICPQVYFGMEHATMAFKSVCDKWQSIIKTDEVKLIIGMSLGKAKSGYDQYAGSGKNEWAEHKDILLRCLQYTETLPKCRGVAYFCYQYFYNPVSGAEENATKAEREKFIPYLETISWQKPNV